MCAHSSGLFGVFLNQIFFVYLGYRKLNKVIPLTKTLALFSPGGSTLASSVGVV